MRQKGSLRPTHQGTALAKDVWMLGVGLGLLADAMADALTDRKAAGCLGE